MKKVFLILGLVSSGLVLAVTDMSIGEPGYFASAVNLESIPHHQNHQSIHFSGPNKNATKSGDCKYKNVGFSCTGGGKSANYAFGGTCQIRLVPQPENANDPNSSKTYPFVLECVPTDTSTHDHGSDTEE